MFIKESKSKNHKYLSIAHSYRENGSNKHHIVANLGRKSQYRPEDIEKICDKLLKMYNCERQMMDFNKISEENRLK